jgi:outer membrane protein TolC
LTTAARAAAQVARRKHQLEQARKELVAAIGVAHGAGEATAVIAEVAGLSPQRISRLLRERRAK